MIEICDFNYDFNKYNIIFYTSELIIDTNEKIEKLKKFLINGGVLLAFYSYDPVCYDLNSPINSFLNDFGLALSIFTLNLEEETFSMPRRLVTAVNSDFNNVNHCHLLLRAVSFYMHLLEKI